MQLFECRQAGQNEIMFCDDYDTLLEAFVQSALASHFRLHILLFLPAMHLNMPSQHWQREWVPFTDLGGRGASLKDTSSRHTM